MQDKNVLRITHKNKKIVLEWDIKNRSNFEDDFLDEIKSEDLDLGNNIYPDVIFERGLVMQSLVSNIPTKTPNEFKKFFYIKDTKDLSSEDFKQEDLWRYKNRLKIFENGSTRYAKSLYKNAIHMKDFYKLWEKHTFGEWKLTTKINKSIDNMFPIKIHFEWNYANFLLFDRFIPDSECDDLFYLVLEMVPLGDRAYNVFSPLFESDIELYGEEIIKQRHRNRIKQKINKPKKLTKKDSVRDEVSGQTGFDF